MIPTKIKYKNQTPKKKEQNEINKRKSDCLP